MSDRRIGDRRAQEPGVIRIKFKEAVWYIILIVVLVISITLNIVFAIKSKYKKDTEAIDYDYSEDYYDDLDNEVE